MRASVRHALVSILLAVAPLPGTALAERSGCVPWAGEPDSLPTIANTDPFLARYASLRASELVSAGKEAERTAPARAHRYFEHALCFDRESREATEGAARTQPLHVYRPRVVATARTRPEALPRLDRLGATVQVATVATAHAKPAHPPPARVKREAPADWRSTDAALAQAEAKLGAADFEGALGMAERLRSQLQRSPAPRGAGERRARTEVIAATAEVALGREADAQRSFERALRANPTLALDPATTSPKVMKVFDAARAKGEPKAGSP